MSKLYDDLDTFFAERGLKRRPKGGWWEDSYDYGVWWYDDDGSTCRLTWIGPQSRPDPSQAGELYSVRLSGPHVSQGGSLARISAGEARGAVEFHCVIPPVEEARDLYPEPIYADQKVEQVLVGWAEECGKLGSLQWVRNRAQTAARAGEATLP